MATDQWKDLEEEEAEEVFEDSDQEDLSDSGANTSK